MYNYILDVCVSWIVRNGICYKKFDDAMTADGAVSLCESHNAYLQEIPNIYVDNIVTEIIGENLCWNGLRTNATHYYWRIGDFPLGDDSPTNIDVCGTVDADRNGNRWRLHDCSILLCAICMIGKQSIGYTYVNIFGPPEMEPLYSIVASTTRNFWFDLSKLKIKLVAMIVPTRMCRGQHPCFVWHASG